MRLAACAAHLHPHHPVAAVDLLGHAALAGRTREAGPAGPRVELGGGVEEGLAAADAAVDALLVVIPVHAGERPLGGPAAGDGVLLRGQSGALLVLLRAIAHRLLPQLESTDLSWTPSRRAGAAPRAGPRTRRRPRACRRRGSRRLRVRRRSSARARGRPAGSGRARWPARPAPRPRPARRRARGRPRAARRTARTAPGAVRARRSGRRPGAAPAGGACPGSTTTG